jgi:hypothetical protein
VTTFTVSWTCKVPVMYREMVNFTPQYLGLLVYSLLPSTCHLVPLLAVCTYAAITLDLLQIQLVWHKSHKQPIPFYAQNFGLKQ